MRPICILCQQPITGIEDTWMYQEQAFPCHPGCASPIRNAIKEFRPIDRPDVPGNVYAFCSVTEQDFSYKWERLPERMKKERREEYENILNKVLDFQVVACNAYAAHHGLGEPKILREMQSRVNQLQGLKQIRRECQPGDHILMPQIPRQRGTAHGEDPRAVFFTMQVANRLAKDGVTLHCVYNSIDWNNPICQHIIRLAWQSQKVHRDTRVFIADYNKDQIRALYGFGWEAMKRNKIFLWVIKCIRDNGMSPIEVAHASKRYFSVLCHNTETERTYVAAICRKLAHAKSIKDQKWYVCKFCHEPVQVEFCPKHKRYRCVRSVLRITKGLQFIDREEDFGYTASTLWAWYCQNNPAQEKYPWKARIVVDNNVS